MQNNAGIVQDAGHLPESVLCLRHTLYLAVNYVSTNRWECIHSQTKTDRNVRSVASCLVCSLYPVTNAVPGRARRVTGSVGKVIGTSSPADGSTVRTWHLYSSSERAHAAGDL